MRYQVNFTDGNTFGRYDSLSQARAVANEFRCKAMVFDLTARMIVYRNWV